MHETGNNPPETKVITSHDGQQHCTAERQPDGNTIAMDCPYTGKGAEFSPTSMVEAALGGCMLLSMGTLAMRSDLDISGTRIGVKISMADKPRICGGMSTLLICRLCDKTAKVGITPHNLLSPLC